MGGWGWGARWQQRAGGGGLSRVVRRLTSRGGACTTRGGRREWRKCTPPAQAPAPRLAAGKAHAVVQRGRSTTGHPLRDDVLRVCYMLSMSEGGGEGGENAPCTVHPLSPYAAAGVARRRRDRTRPQWVRPALRRRSHRRRHRRGRHRPLRPATPCRLFFLQATRGRAMRSTATAPRPWGLLPPRGGVGWALPAVAGGHVDARRRSRPLSGLREMEAGATFPPPLSCPSPRKPPRMWRGGTPRVGGP